MFIRKSKVFTLAFFLVFLLSGCAKGVGENPSSVGSMPVPSQGQVALESSQSSEKSEPSKESSGQSSGESAASATAKAYSSKAQANLNAGSYQVKTGKYTYSKDNLDYSVSYPQLVSKAAHSDEWNKALKVCAMQTVSTLGTAKREQKISVRCSGDVTYEGKDFLSVGFNEFEKLSPKASTSHVMRTVNIDLKTGQAVGFSDLIRKGDSFYLALLKAAKSQLEPADASALNASAIREGLDPNVIYFTDEAVGFCVRLVSPKTKLVRITLDYNTVQPFSSGNAIWGNFI